MVEEMRGRTGRIISPSMSANCSANSGITVIQGGFQARVLRTRCDK
jgi:hypothetical protein